MRIGFKRRIPVEVQRQPQRVPKKQDDGCKIKIKKTSAGKQIEFEGKCSKEQIEVAKQQLNDGYEPNNFEDY